MDQEITRRVAAGLAAVRAQTAFFHAQFGKAESKWKHDGTRVTAADIAISGDIFRELQAQFGEDEYFSEESEPGRAPVPLAARFAWVLDPIDGTNNFALGIPVCSIALALLEHGQPVCGFIYDLGVRTLYHGGPGLGLFIDGVATERIARTDSDTKIVAMHSPVDPQHMPLVQRVLGDYKLRAFGSGSLHLTYVALGRIDACLDLTVKVWDIAGAWAFCRHAGVQAHFFGPEPFPMRQFDLHMKSLRYLAASPEACGEILPNLRDLVLPPR